MVSLLLAGERITRTPDRATNR